MYLRIFIIFILALSATSTARAAEPADRDQDGLPDIIEVQLGSDPYRRDTDADGYVDGVEASLGYNPLVGNKDRALKRSVKVDLNTQRLELLLNEVRIASYPVSTGLPGTPTPTGTFQVINKKPLVNYVGVGYNFPKTKWNLEFKKRYYLHGAYWHNQFGKRPMSHGCVNISYANAENVYKFLDVGDSVMVVGKTPRGAVAQK